jgi:hypothetical protein
MISNISALTKSESRILRQTREKKMKFTAAFVFLCSLALASAKESKEERNNKILASESNRFHSITEIEEFENNNLLKHGNLTFVIKPDEGNVINVLGTVFDLDDATPVLDLENAHCFHNGKKEVCPEPTVIRGQNSDGDIIVAEKDADEGYLSSIVVFFADGRQAELANVGTNPSEGLFAEITMADFDPLKLDNFYGGLRHDGDGHNRALQEKARHLRKRKGGEQAVGADDARSTRNLQGGACTTFLELEVAIGYDSTFCNAFGGKSQSDSRVEAIVAAASALYEKPGMCIKLRLTDIEGYCDEDEDEWRDMIRLENSGCERNTYGSLQAFRDFWNEKRGSVQRDAAHLFSGTGFECGNDGFCTIGCASVGTWCTQFGYGVNCKFATSFCFCLWGFIFFLTFLLSNFF